MRQDRRRQFLIATSALLAASQGAMAQKRNVRIGALVPRRNSVILPHALKRLAELGYVEGKNMVLDFRSADGVVERFPALARELIEAKHDLIFAVGSEAAARALVEAKSRIPVVLIASDYDPVKAGIVSNLRRPGGLVTGVTGVSLELAAKRIEIMREIVPKANRYLVLSDNFTKGQLDATVEAARTLRVEIVTETFGAPPYDLDAAFARGRAAQANALIVLPSPVFLDQAAKIFDLAMKYRLPTATNSAVYGEHGVLFWYGVNQVIHVARAGDIAASILGGKPPGDIPIEQPTRFEMAINLKTARALGITVPQSMLQRADRVIE